ncbi:DUF202 domain-containing protein [Cellulomonas sp. HZM]|uniref:DUF202 domain-containing protein n=1 Tax=Cellulomonas sp. HZM TaxID=1454010 RepID=UPI00068DBC50|nr:DUF202 domain-containing protein [Cellulomonas sp. HZM]
MSGPEPAAPESFAVERTRLAWRRTALSLAAGSVAAGKLLEEVVGAGGWAVTLVGLGAAAAMVRAARRRHTRDDARPASTLVAACATAMTLLGAAGLWLVLAWPR